MNNAEEWISDLEDKTNGNHTVRTADRRQNGKKKKASNIRHIWDNIKCAYLCIIGIPEGEEREKGIKNACEGLPWWRSGWESACQCREHGFEPWSGKIPHAAEQLGPWTTTTEPVRLEPVLCNKRGRDSERPTHCDEEWPRTAMKRGPRLPQLDKALAWNEDPTQPKINKF